MTVENERVPVGLCGENVQLGVKFEDTSKLIVGNVVCDPMQPISLVTKFEAKIYTLETPTNRPILKGTQVMLFVGNREVPAIISKLKVISSFFSSKIVFLCILMRESLGKAMKSLKKNHVICLVENERL